MKLTDKAFDARFVKGNGKGGIDRVERLDQAQGLLFFCPCAAGHVLVIWFSNRGVPEGEEPKPRWNPSGANLETLTLSPSICTTCWHGWIRDGQMVQALS